MNDNGWRKIVKIGLTALMIVLILRIGGDVIVSLFKGDYHDKNIIQIVVESIGNVFNWFIDVLNYAFFK